MTTYAPARPRTTRPPKRKATSRPAPKPKPKQRTPIDPRIRERRAAVARAQGRRRLNRLLWVLGVVTIAAAGTGAVLSPLLDINQITIHGAEGAHADEVRSVIGIEPGEALLLVDTGAAVERVEALTWVDEVRVERKLPGTLRVEVIPRFPVGWRGGAQDSVVLLDRFGGTISREAHPPPGIPQVDASGEGIAAAAEVAAALSPTMRPEVWQIVVRDGRVSALLASGVEVRFGDSTQARAKVTAAEAVFKALNGEFIKYIDVSVPSAPATG